MDSSTKDRKDPCLIKTHFLKPYVTSIDGYVAELPPRQCFPVTSSDIKVMTSKISSTGFRLAHGDFKSWAKKMEALHEPTWIKAGIFEAIKASTYKIPANPSLILALADKWCPKTKSFVFPWGEATITLEDVMVLLGFSVSGSSVSAPLESSEMKDAVAKLERGRVENRSRDGQIRPRSWISSYRNIDDDKIEHEAFLTVWLSEFVFPDAWRSSISGNALPIAVRLARGEKIALAPAVLASLYKDLSTIHGFGGCESRKRIELKSLLKLVQVWVWERFSNIRPKEPREIRMGEPRIARWNFRKKRCVKNDEKNDERLSFDGFEWRPYAKFLKNWSHPKFYVEEGKWMSVDDSLDDEFLSFARCLRASRLVGIGFVEDYYPNRVAMQFGFDQVLPGLVTHLSNNITEMEAWDDYNKSLVGSKLYIPSRLATTSVTANYQDWWLKSVSEFLSNERNTGDNDHGCGGSTLREETLAKRTSEHSRNMRCKRAHEDDDDDDNITIAEMLKSRKITEGDASQPLGKRSRHEEYNNDSGLCGKSASEDETETPQEMEPRIVAENIKTKEEEIGERSRQRTLKMEKIALKLEARVVEWLSVCKKLKHHLI